MFGGTGFFLQREVLMNPSESVQEAQNNGPYGISVGSPSLGSGRMHFLLQHFPVGKCDLGT